MSNQLFVVVAVLSVVLLVSQTASCKYIDVDDVEQPDELQIVNPGSAFPMVVTDPELLERLQDTRRCNPSQCNTQCRRLGFRIGRCNNRGVCVCSR